MRLARVKAAFRLVGRRSRRPSAEVWTVTAAPPSIRLNAEPAQEVLADLA